MNIPEGGTEGWKAKVSHELIEYGLNVVYLMLVFASFTVYRRLSLAAYDIQYTNYWVSVVEALILGKVIMIGGVLHLDRGFEDKPLIYPTLFKTAVFSIFVFVFKVVEHMIKGLWHGEGIAGAVAAISGTGWELVLANSLVVLVAFIPFFAVKELGRVLGTKRMWALFFRKGPAA